MGGNRPQRGFIWSGYRGLSYFFDMFKKDFEKVGK
jgi:hypothetical protein